VRNFFTSVATHTLSRAHAFRWCVLCVLMCQGGWWMVGW